MTANAAKTKYPIRNYAHYAADADSPAASLKLLQEIRKYCIRSQQRTDRATEALIARFLDYNAGLPEATRKEIFKLARKTRLGIEEWMRSNEEPEEKQQLPAIVVRVVEVSFKARQEWDLERRRYEAEMIGLARQLPAWPWVKGVKGVAELGLAIIIGETGDLSNYSGPAKLWKRLGLACIDGVRQGFVPAEITGKERKEAWELRGYNPQRRAEVWAHIDDIMFRAQWRRAKDDVPAHPIGPYGEVYGERKAWNVARGLMPTHADRDARRFMAKRFLCDLWVAWQDRALPQVAAE